MGEILRIFCGILLFLSCVDSKEFVFNKDKIFVEKSGEFVNQTSSELFEKTGVNLYVYIAKSLESKPYAEYRDRVITDFKEPFAAILLITDDKKLDIIASSDEVLNKKERKKVYWEYMSPLLPQKDSEITPQSLSAVVFNGYVESVDLIADKFGVEIKHNIAKDEKGANMVAKSITYVMLISLLGLFAFGYFAKRREK